MQDDPKLEEFIESRRAPEGSLTRRFGCFGWLLGWVIVAAALGLIYLGFDALESPWAYSFFGTRPTLTGEWVTEFTTPSGMRGVAYLDLTHPISTPNGGIGSTRQVEGTA